MKRCIFVIIMILMFMTLSGCGNSNQNHVDESVKETSDQSDILGLSASQKMEDYVYLWNVLRDSYPCWGILEREDADIETIEEEYKTMIEESNSDFDFYSAIYSALWRLGRNGHLWIIEPEEYNGYKEMYEAMKKEDGLKNRYHWGEVLLSSETELKYEKIKALLDKMQEENGEVDSKSNAADEDYMEENDNVETLLFPGKEIGYLKINSFSGNKKTDGKRINQFYNECKNCTDLIIDLTANSGGDEGYWEQLLVAPNIDKTLRNSNTALVRMSDNNKPYLENVFTKEELHAISELSFMPELEESDKELASHYVEISHIVKPAKERSAFHGHIWVLVNEAVYSASESFAIFCKDTGFATLVGQQTGGDGIGMDPVFIQLPNSGILIQYTALFGLNKDGSSNEEKGTTPDIISKHGENPIITALHTIGANDIP